MIERESPLAVGYRPGRHGNVAEAAGVQMGETRPGSIVQVTAWPGAEKAALAAIKSVSGLTIADRPGAGAIRNGRSAFGFAPGRWLVADQSEGLGPALQGAVGIDAGTVVGLSHGRTAIHISGPKAEWVLSKFFAIDFAIAAFPVGDGRSTAHHDIFAQIQRTGPARFEIYVFRSLARAFWSALCHTAEEVGYEVI